MGLFSGKTRVYVSSSVYNLAGDVGDEDGPSFLTTAVLQSVLSESDRSLGEVVSKASLNSAGVRQRRFFKWAQSNYALGMPDASVGAPYSVGGANTQTLRSGLLSKISLDPNQSLVIVSALIDNAEADYWADDWIRRNHPNIAFEDWSSDFDPDGGAISITVHTTGSTTTIAAPADLTWGLARNTNRKILYVLYQVETDHGEEDGVEAGEPQFLTYRMSSGNTDLDSLAPSETAMTEFYPPIPLRLDNVMVSEPGLESEYDAAKAAFKELTSDKLDSLLGKLGESPSLNDIDFAFIHLGVPLNTKEQAGQAYLFRFFESLIPAQTNTRADFYSRLRGLRDYKTAVAEWENWLSGNGPRGSSQIANWSRSTYGLERPTPPDHTGPPAFQELRLQSSGIPDFDIRLRWGAVTARERQGNARHYDGNSSRKRLAVGRYWIHKRSPITFRVPSYEQWVEGDVRRVFRDREISRISVFFQHSRTRYTELEILGLEHVNYVYKGKTVTTFGQDAMDEPAGETAFLVPLHHPTAKNLNLQQASDLAKVSNFLVLNSYQKVTTPWYATGFFRFVIVVGTVAISVLTMNPAGLGVTAGLLGTNAAVGAALGASASWAAIAGAVTNTVAAAVLVTLIQKGSQELFGDKWGVVIGTIASFVALNAGTTYMNTGSLSIDWSSLMNIENLIQVTNSVTKAYTMWMNADTEEIQASIREMSEEYADRVEEIQEKTAQMLGVTDPSEMSIISDSAEEQLGETSSTFLHRTLLTGSDLAQLSRMMIENFSEVSLGLPRALH